MVFTIFHIEPLSSQHTYTVNMPEMSWVHLYVIDATHTYDMLIGCVLKGVGTMKLNPVAMKCGGIC